MAADEEALQEERDRHPGIKYGDIKYERGSERERCENERKRERESALLAKRL